MNQSAFLLSCCLTFLAAAATAQEHGSSFGHSRTRELAELGRLPTPTDVAVADIVNYHRHRLPLPKAGELVALDLRFGAAQVDPYDTAWLQVGYTTDPTGDRRDLPPLRLALVIDCSGSMQAAGKMENVKRGLQAFVGRLRAADCVTLVAYSDDARLLEPCRQLGDGRWLREAIARLEPNGATNLHGGLMLGLRELAGGREPAGRESGDRESLRRPGTSQRVLLLTDGIANRGVTDPEQILRDSQSYTSEGIDLSTIGVGQDLNTTLLDRLARGGHGLFHFVADSQDIDKVFVAEFEALMAPVARSVRLLIDLPSRVSVDAIYGGKAVSTGTGFSIELPELNRGATGVVLARLRVRGEHDHSSRSFLRADARLEYRAAYDGAQRTARATAEAEVRGAGRDPLVDPEVKKNATIAELAQGLHDMAEHAAARRWAEADRCVRGPIETAERRFPDGGDEDLRRVLKMAQDHRRTLQNYLDRFRDF